MPQLTENGLSDRHRLDEDTDAYNPFELRPILDKPQTDVQLQGDAITRETEFSLLTDDFQLPHFKLQVLHDYNAYKDFTFPLQLPPFDTEVFEQPLENLDGSISSTSRSESPASTRPDQTCHDEDIWITACNLGPLKDDTKLISWGSFADSQHEENSPVYISEAGDAAFDAALQTLAKDSDGLIHAGTPVKTEGLLASLRQLALGRPSALFPLNHDKNSFRQAIANQRFSGCSLDSSQALFQDILDIGTSMLQLKSFRDTVYSSLDPCPSIVALASVVDLTLTAIEEHTISDQQNIQTALRLQDVIAPVKDVLHIIDALVTAVQDVSIDSQAISNIFEKAQQLEHRNDIASLLCKILERLAIPWLESIRQSLTVSPNSISLPAAKATDEGDKLDHDLPHSIDMPSFLPAEDVNLINNINQCSQYIHNVYTQLPSQHSRCLDIAPPPLKLAFTYEDVETIASEAQKYKMRISAAFGDAHSDGFGSTELRAPVDATENNPSAYDSTWQRDIATSIRHMSSTPNNAATTDEIYASLMSRLSGEPTEQALLLSPVSLVPHLSIQQFLVAHNKVLNDVALRSILCDHDLLSHLEILQDFYLCQSGAFTLLLKRALFSSDAEPAERSRGFLRTGARSLGLRLESKQRREWPPASSELTLALMGVLNESYGSRSIEDKCAAARSTLSNQKVFVDVQSIDLPRTERNGVLPGGLSFAIRSELSDLEIERTMDSQSIFALDFLRIVYVPPRMLSTIITDSSLQKYDRIFRFLLRMMRMQFVVDELFHDIKMMSRGDNTKDPGRGSQVHLFRIRATYLVTSLSSHFHAIISKNMAKFQGFVSSLGKRTSFENEPVNEDLEVPTVLSDLATLHDHYLSTIMTGLCQKLRQHRTAELLEDLFECILSFSRITREHDSQPEQTEFGLAGLHTKLNSILMDLKNSLGDLCEKMESADPSAKYRNRKPHSGALTDTVSKTHNESLSDLRQLFTIIDI